MNFSDLDSIPNYLGPPAPAPKKSPLLAMLGGVGGFLVGGPVGAVVGAVAGSALTKPSAAAPGPSGGGSSPGPGPGGSGGRPPIGGADGPPQALPPAPLFTPPAGLPQPPARPRLPPSPPLTRPPVGPGGPPPRSPGDPRGEYAGFDPDDGTGYDSDDGYGGDDEEYETYPGDPPPLELSTDPPFQAISPMSRRDGFDAVRRGLNVLSGPISALAPSALPGLPFIPTYAAVGAPLPRTLLAPRMVPTSLTHRSPAPTATVTMGMPVAPRRLALPPRSPPKRRVVVDMPAAPAPRVTNLGFFRGIPTVRNRQVGVGLKRYGR